MLTSLPSDCLPLHTKPVFDFPNEGEVAPDRENRRQATRCRIRGKGTKGSSPKRREIVPIRTEQHWQYPLQPCQAGLPELCTRTCPRHRAAERKEKRSAAKVSEIDRGMVMGKGEKGMKRTLHLS